MNPKNIDRVGKGFLVVAGAAIAAVSKKYGPTILKEVNLLFRKIRLKK